MSQAPGPRPKDPLPRTADHYSYTVYADPAMADQFDRARFSGPIGELLAATQADVLRDYAGAGGGGAVLDVGTGTGRAALVLAEAGARVTAVDASAEMLRVAEARAHARGSAIAFAIGDAHHLAFDDGSFDTVVSLRVLMHTPDWRQCVAEACRVARRRVIVDYPAAGSVAALQSAARHLAHRLGARTEPYRVFSGRQIRSRVRAPRLPHHPRASSVRPAHRRSQGAAFARRHHGDRARARVGRTAEAGRIARHDSGGTVKVLVTGATGFTGGHLARHLLSEGDTVRALVREPARAADLADSWRRGSRRRLVRPRHACQGCGRRRGGLQHRGPVSAGGFA